MEWSSCCQKAGLGDRRGQEWARFFWFLQGRGSQIIYRLPAWCLQSQFPFPVLLLPISILVSGGAFPRKSMPRASGQCWLLYPAPLPLKIHVLDSAAEVSLL